MKRITISILLLPFTIIHSLIAQERGMSVQETYDALARMRVLSGHTDGIAVAWSPDGNQLASGSHDKTIRLWDTRTEQERAVLRGHSNHVCSVAYSPDRTTLASGSSGLSDSTICLWDVRTAQEKAVLRGHRSSVNSIAYSPDGTQLASGSDDETIRLWDVRTTQIKALLRGHTNWILSVAWHPDGAQLASGSYDRTIRLWDPTAQCISQKYFEKKEDGSLHLKSGISLRELAGLTLFAQRKKESGKPVKTVIKELIAEYPEIQGALLHICRTHLAS